ncbi:MAG: Gfo/Idh/MocA family oxidoreductase, partial [Sphaerochaetaceae bacterium]|nr:Gfo/Idh/MocA family oxidoreductase [Sphaerochaetaceae bacterium]
MEKIRTAVIGCGKVGYFHADAFKEIENSEFVACLGRDQQKTDVFAAKYGVKGYTDLDKMIKECGVQAVAICTPHPLHAQFAVRCCELGVHIVVEKPLATSIEDCDAILEAAHRNGVIGSTIYQRRFYRPSMRVKKAIEDGKIGKPILGTVNMLGWRDMDYYRSDPWRGTWKGEGGGVLINQAAHQMDLLLWYMGEIDEVYGVWDTFNHPGLEVDDTAVAVIRFKSGAMGSIVVSNSQNPALFGDVRIHGSNGATVGVQTDGGAMFIAGMSGITEPPVNDIWTVPGEENMLETYRKEDSDFFNSTGSTNYFHVIQLTDFLNAVQKGTEPLVTLEDGRRSVELITAIYRSNRDHRPVKFPLKPENGTDYDGRL